VKDLPPLEEDDLREFYAALVESGAEEAARRYEVLEAPKEERLRLGDGEREEVLRGLAERVLGLNAQKPPPLGEHEGANMVAGPSRLTGIVSRLGVHFIGRRGSERGRSVGSAAGTCEPEGMGSPLRSDSTSLLSICRS
jgi:hypothetical protein